MGFFLIEETGVEKPTIKGYAHRKGSRDEETEYECDFKVPPDFGEVGAILVENEHHKEMYLKKIVLDGFPLGNVSAICNSWVHSKFQNKEKRVFFTNMVRFTHNIMIELVGCLKIKLLRTYEYVKMIG